MNEAEFPPRELYGSNFHQFSQHNEYAEELFKEGQIYPDGALPNKLIKMPLRWRYGNATLESFRKVHASTGWLGRKIVAIPLAALDTIRSLAHLIFILVFPIFSSFDAMGIAIRKKALLYTSLRYLCSAGSRLATLVNDVWGSYLVQEASFQSYYYNCCAMQLTDSFTIPSSLFLQPPTLFRLRNATQKKKRQIIEQYTLTNYIKAFDSVPGGFWEVLKKADKEMLKQFTVQSLKESRLPTLLRGEFFEIPIYLRTLQELESVSIDEVRCMLNSNDVPQDAVARLRERLLQHEPEPSDEKWDPIETVPFSRFLRLPSSFLNEHASSIPSWIYSYLSPKQAREIDLQKLSFEQIYRFIYFTTEEFEEKVRRIPYSWLNQNMKWIRDYQWKKCSDDQITHLDLTVATPTDLMNIFSGLSYLESDLENDKHRFSLLSPATVNANLSKFDEFNFDLLTQEQWAVLDTKEVTKTIFCMMFSIPDFSKAMRRFEQLSPAQQDDLKARFGDEWIIQHITK